MLYCQQCKHLVKSTRTEQGQGEAVFHCQECGALIPIRDGLLPGTVVAGFEIIREIGRGAMGIVYEARQINLERRVAVKILSEETACDEVYVQRFFREARSAASLSHPNIVQAYDAGVTEDGVYYFVMELIHGENLNQILNRDGRVPFHTAIRYFLPIAGALANAWTHCTLSHGDIKPENIIIQPDGKAKLADFGLARRSKDKEIENEDLRATPAYAPPEIIQWKKGVPGFKSDMYSFGATMYHVLTGREPFPGDDPQLVCNMQISAQQISANKVAPGIPEEISQLIDNLMEKNPENRPESWELVEEALEDMILREADKKQFYLGEREDAESSRKLRIPATRTSLVVALLVVLALICVATKWVLHFAETPSPELPSGLEAADKDVESYKAKWSILKSKFPNGEPPLADLRKFVEDAGDAAPEEAVKLLRALEEKQAQIEAQRKKDNLTEETDFLQERNALLDEADSFISGENTEEYDLEALTELQESVLRRFAKLKNASTIQKELLLTVEQKDLITAYLDAISDALDDLKSEEQEDSSAETVTQKHDQPKETTQTATPDEQSQTTKKTTDESTSDSKSATKKKKTTRKAIRVKSTDADGNITYKTIYVETEAVPEPETPVLSLTEQLWQSEMSQLPLLVGTSATLAEKRTDEIDSLQNIMKMSDFPEEKRALGNSLIRFIQFSKTDLLPYITASKKILKGQELFRNTNPGSMLDDIIGKEIRMKYMDKETKATLTQKAKWEIAKKNEREDRIALNIVRLPVFSKLPEEFREILFTKLIMSGNSIDSALKLFEQSSALSQETLNRLKIVAEFFRKTESPEKTQPKTSAATETQPLAKAEPLLKIGGRTREEVEADRANRLLERAEREAQKTSESSGRTKRNISRHTDSKDR